MASMRYLLRGIVWVIFGLAMAALGFYVGSRQQRSMAVIHGAKEVMTLQALADQHRDADFAQRLTSALDYYSTELDEYSNGRGLNSEHRNAVRAARAEIDGYRASRKSSLTISAP